MFILLMVFFAAAGGARAQNLDINLLKHINLHRPVSLDPAFLAVTHTAEPLAAAVPAAMFAAALISKNADLEYNALSVAGAVALSALATEGLKYAVHRPRPYVTYPFIDHVSADSDPSFPSGHTSVAFAAATSVTLAYHRWYVVAPVWTWAAVVAYSRLDLGMHYPTDVLAGAVLGAGSSWLSWKAMKWLRKKTK
jgi:undecaprenyl-diphosphatase